MSVLIKGMEMPKSCAKCKLFGEYGCPFVGAVGYAMTEGRRNEDCPIVPLPPHGRLIDADELIAEHNGIFDCCVFPSDIRAAPTILEAEP